MKMAYSPTTWNTNDVITKDKLNKIEQGVKTATRLSGTDIDADKDWGGKNITNPRLIVAAPSAITPATIASYAGPYAHKPNESPYWETPLSFSIPSDFSAIGIPALHRLVRVTIAYSMTTGTTTGKSVVSINGVDCGMTLAYPGGTSTKTMYIAAGSTIAFSVYNPSNDYPEPVISNIDVTLDRGYPFGEVNATDYPALANTPGAVITPYRFTHSESECTFQPADLLQPRYAADADLGYWMVDKYDQEVDVYHLLVVMQHDNGTFEWLDGDGIWLPRRAVEGTFNVIGSFDRRKAHL
jgi:hypothetical protein